MASDGSWKHFVLVRFVTTRSITTLEKVLAEIVAFIMGGPGSGGYKNSPGDTETHAAWEIVQQDPGSTQVRSIASITINARILMCLLFF